MDLIQYANIAGIALFTITLSWETYRHGFCPVRILNIANFLLALFIFVKIRTLEGFLHRVNVLLDQASRRDLEHKLVKEKEGGELGQMVLNLNYFLDVVEAFIREIIMPLKYAGERKYWRKVVYSGFPGVFQTVAKVLNEPLKAIENNDRFIRKVQLIEKLSELGGGIQTNLMLIQKITERLSRIRDESRKTVGVVKEGRESAEKIVSELNGPIKTVESYTHVVEELAQKAGSVTS